VFDGGQGSVAPLKMSLHLLILSTKAAWLVLIPNVETASIDAGVDS